MRNLRIFISVLVISFPINLVLADTKQKVDSWFNNMNYSNITAPGVYKGQSARFATLGGISARAPITQPFQFVNVQTPKFSAGCGGIDFYAGGFSAIDADQFVDNLRAIGQNAQSLAFMLAIQVVSPQLSGVMEDIQTWADKYLNMNMDSCEAASKLVGGAMQYFDEEKANCIATRQKSYGEDFSKASFGCSTGGKRKSTKDSDGDKNAFSFVRGNIAWYVLMQDPFFRGDVDFAEVVMNLTGTAVFKDTPGSDDTPVIKRVITPAVSKDGAETQRFKNIYTALLHGNKAADKLRLYTCNGTPAAAQDSCQDLSNNLQTINPNWTGLQDRVATLLTSIVTKIEGDTALTTQEQGLIASTNVPVYRFLSTASTYFPSGTNVADLGHQYVSLIANDILTRSLAGIVEKAEQQSTMLKKDLSDSVRVKEYRNNLSGLKTALDRRLSENRVTVNQLMQMQENILKYERALLPKVGKTLAASAKWGAR